MGDAAEVLDDERFRVGVGGDYFALARQVRGDAATHAMIERSARSPAASGSRSPPTTRCRSRRHPLVPPAGRRVDQAGHVVVTHTDVTSRVAAEQASAWQARHDHLTGLPNRARLHELIDAELRPARPPGGRPSSSSTSTASRTSTTRSATRSGDELLRQMAARLDGATRAQDTVGRLGGDEFVVLCPDCDADGRRGRWPQRFQSTFDRPFVLGGRAARLTASIGVATAAAGRRATVRSTDLVRDADLAMYAAKAAGRNGSASSARDLRSRAQQRLQLAAELRDAIDARPARAALPADPAPGDRRVARRGGPGALAAPRARAAAAG